MNIHFVCSGNTFRSRLAEAYAKSIASNRQLHFSSSGIVAKIHRLGNGPINWYTMRLIQRYQLIPYMSWREKQTTPIALQKVDLLICMKPEHLTACREQYGYQGESEIWNIPDLNEMPGYVETPDPDLATEMKRITMTETIYQMITKKVDRLRANLA